MRLVHTSDWHVGVTLGMIDRRPDLEVGADALVSLVEQVRLVRFKPGTIEINPLPHAPRELGQELMRKLKAWTGRVWIVAVSDEEGAVPLGVQRREREARAIESVREHPSVKQVMQHFPGARITAVRPVAEPDPQESDSDTPDEFKEDGTNR